MPIAKSYEYISIDIMPSLEKKTWRSQSPTLSILVYFFDRIASGVFSDLALIMK